MATKNVAKKTEEMMAPARALNELALANAERLMELQMDNVRKYTSLVLDGLKEAAAVQDPEGAQKFMTSRVEAARATGETLRSDTEVLVKLTQEYATDVQKIVKESMATLPKLAA